MLRFMISLHLSKFNNCIQIPIKLRKKLIWNNQTAIFFNSAKFKHFLAFFEYKVKI